MARAIFNFLSVISHPRYIAKRCFYLNRKLCLGSETQAVFLLACASSPETQNLHSKFKSSADDVALNPIHSSRAALGWQESRVVKFYFMILTSTYQLNASDTNGSTQTSKHFLPRVCNLNTGISTFRLTELQLH